MNWLHEEWKQAWKWLQVQLAALVVAGPIIYENLPKLQAYVSPTLFRYAMAAAGVAMIVNAIRKKPGAP